MQYKYERTINKSFTPAPNQFNLEYVPNNWNLMSFIGKYNTLTKILANIIKNPEYIGTRVRANVYSYYIDDYKLHKREHEVVIIDHFIDCNIPGNKSFRYYFD